MKHGILSGALRLVLGLAGFTALALAFSGADEIGPPWQWARHFSLCLGAAAACFYALSLLTARQEENDKDTQKQQ